jgi:hypothetical protein
MYKEGRYLGKQGIERRKEGAEGSKYWRGRKEDI